MEEKTELAQISFVAHKMLLMEQEKKTERYKLAFITSAILLAATNLCWFLCR